MCHKQGLLNGCLAYEAIRISRWLESSLDSKHAAPPHEAAADRLYGPVFNQMTPPFIAIRQGLQAAREAFFCFQSMPHIHLTCAVAFPRAQQRAIDRARRRSILR